MSREQFVNAYITCALWSSSDIDDNGNGPESLQGYTLAEETETKMTAEAVEFYNYYHDVWDALDGYGDEQAGHDFWLTRNGHGAGFWDRGIGRAGEELTKVCKGHGERTLYRGDDGLVYQL